MDSAAAVAQSVTKRLQNELMSLMMANCDGISAFPDGDNLFSWVATITGPTGTVFADTTYRVSLKFPTDYPFVPPLVRFETPIFHPNVDQHGNICLDILKDKWSAVYSVQTVLLSIQSLLGEYRKTVMSKSARPLPQASGLQPS